MSMHVQYNTKIWCYYWYSRSLLTAILSWLISATGDPIHFMFGFRVGFSWSADQMALFLVTSNPSCRQAAILDNFEWPHLRYDSFDPLI